MTKSHNAVFQWSPSQSLDFGKQSVLLHVTQLLRKCHKLYASFTYEVQHLGVYLPCCTLFIRPTVNKWLSDAKSGLFDVNNSDLRHCYFYTHSVTFLCTLGKFNVIESCGITHIVLTNIHVAMSQVLVGTLCSQYFTGVRPTIMFPMHQCCGRKYSPTVQWQRRHLETNGINMKRMFPKDGELSSHTTTHQRWTIRCMIDHELLFGLRYAMAPLNERTCRSMPIYDLILT